MDIVRSEIRRVPLHARVVFLGSAASLHDEVAEDRLREPPSPGLEPFKVGFSLFAIVFVRLIPPLLVRARKTAPDTLPLRSAASVRGKGFSNMNRPTTLFGPALCCVVRRHPINTRQNSSFENSGTGPVTFLLIRFATNRLFFVVSRSLRTAEMSSWPIDQERSIHSSGPSRLGRPMISGWLARNSSTSAGTITFLIQLCTSGEMSGSGFLSFALLTAFPGWNPTTRRSVRRLRLARFEEHTLVNEKKDQRQRVPARELSAAA